MFTCPSCDQECRRLIASPTGWGEFDKEDRKLRCEECYDASKFRPTYLHQRFVDNNGIEGCKNLTVAKANIISNRRICSEDRNVVIDQRSGKETQF